jgi:hypothetical protein
MGKHHQSRHLLFSGRTFVVYDFFIPEQNTFLSFELYLLQLSGRLYSEQRETFPIGSGALDPPGRSR